MIPTFFKIEQNYGHEPRVELNVQISQAAVAKLILGKPLELNFGIEARKSILSSLDSVQSTLNENEGRVSSCFLHGSTHFITTG